MPQVDAAGLEQVAKVEETIRGWTRRLAAEFDHKKPGGKAMKTDGFP